MRLGNIDAEELAMFQQKLNGIGGPLQGLIRKRRLKLAREAAAATTIAVLAIVVAAL